MFVVLVDDEGDGLGEEEDGRGLEEAGLVPELPGAGGLELLEVAIKSVFYTEMHKNGNQDPEGDPVEDLADGVGSKEQSGDAHAYHEDEEGNGPEGEGNFADPPEFIIDKVQVETEDEGGDAEGGGTGVSVLVGALYGVDF